jgi:hypothetical protein
LYGLCQDATFQRATSRRISSFVSFFVRFESRFFVPTAPRSCGRAQKLSGLAAAPTLRPAPSLPGHTLTASSTTASLGAIGMTIGGEPACGRDQSRHNLVSGGSEDPNHDAVMRIGSEAPKRRTHSPFRHGSQGNTSGPRHLEPSSATPSQADGRGRNYQVSFSDLRS